MAAAAQTLTSALLTDTKLLVGLVGEASGLLVLIAGTDRASLTVFLAGLFLIAYFGLIVAAIGLGIAREYTTAATALTWFTAALPFVLVAVAVLAHRARHEAVPTE